MRLVCIQNSSLLVDSKSQKISASYCLPFQHSRGKNQPVGGSPPPSCLFRVIYGEVIIFDYKFYLKTTKFPSNFVPMVRILSKILSIECGLVASWSAQAGGMVTCQGDTCITPCISYERINIPVWTRWFWFGFLNHKGTILDINLL